MALSPDQERCLGVLSRFAIFNEETFQEEYPKVGDKSDQRLLTLCRSVMQGKPLDAIESRYLEDRSKSRSPARTSPVRGRRPRRSPGQQGVYQLTGWEVVPSGSERIRLRWKGKRGKQRGKYLYSRAIKQVSNRTVTTTSGRQFQLNEPNPDADYYDELASGPITLDQLEGIVYGDEDEDYQ
jgi:hypothetical protein